MSERLPAHTLMFTYLTERLRRRRITADQLADLLRPTPEATVKSWVAGWSSPAPVEISRLAHALQVDPIELAAGWLIDNGLVGEAVIRSALLEPLGSDFPCSTAWDLIAPRKRQDMSVADPHDERVPSSATMLPSAPGKVRKRSAAAQDRLGEPWSGI